jgi:signal transduction histidine kinase
VIGLRRALLALAVAGVVAGAVSTVLLVDSDHVNLRGVNVAFGLLIGWSFIGTGLFAWWRRPGNRFGALMTAVGFAWFLGTLSAANASLPFTISIAVANLAWAVCIHMLLAYPSGRLETRLQRWVVAVIYAVATVAALPGTLFETSEQFGCDNCPDNAFLVYHDKGLASLLFGIQSVVAVGAIALVLAILAGRWRRATPPQRRTLAPVLWSGFATASLIAVTVSVDVAGAPDGASEVVYLAALVAFASVPYAFLVGLLRTRMSRAGAVGELVERLGQAPAASDLRAALADALGDRSLSLAFWIPSSRRYVDAEGRPVALPGDGGRRAWTAVEREGRPVAALIHDASLLEQPDLVRTAGAAAALSLENERLDAELRARVEELRASRQRIVEIGLAERRRLERNLHDGAQQRLVSLSLRLGLARSKVREDPAEAEELLESAEAELQQGLAELRELARGIHPAILADHGLDAALEALTGRAPLPVEVVGTPRERLPEPVEAAAYFVVAEALTNVAKYAHASRASVVVERVNGAARIVVDDDGIGGADPGRGSGLRGLADRIAALDGHLELESRPGRGTTLRAEIPCAS